MLFFAAWLGAWSMAFPIVVAASAFELQAALFGIDTGQVSID